MWKLPKGNEFLPNLSLKKLQEYYTREERTKPKVRLLCAINRKRGKSIDEIAYNLDMPRRTVHGSLQRFVERGIVAKDSIKQPGKSPRLTQTQRKQLMQTLERGPPHKPNGLWSTKEVRELIYKKFGIKYAPQHVWRILLSSGFSLQKPRKHHHKAASPEDIAEFKKKLGNKPDTTERKGLLWARKTKQHSVSSRSLSVDGHAEAANQLPT